MVTFALISFFITFCTCFLLSILLVTCGKKYIQFTIFNINLCIWTVFNILYISAESYEDAFIYVKFASASIALIPYLFFKTALSFSNTTIKPIYRTINTTVAILLSSLMFTDLMIKGVKPFMNFKFVPEATVFFYIYCLYLIIVVTIGHIFLYKSIKYNYKNKFIFYAYIIGWIGGMTTLPVYLGIPIYPFAVILVAIYTLLVSYALIQHRIFDFALTIINLSIKALCFVTIFFSYLISLKIYDLIFTNDHNTYLIFNLLYIIFSIQLYQSLVSKLKVVREKMALGIPYNKLEIRNNIGKHILDIVEIDQLLKQLKNIIEQQIGVKIISFYVASELGIKEHNNPNLKFTKYFGQDIEEKYLIEMQEAVKDEKFFLSIKYNEVDYKFRKIMDRADFQGLVPFLYNDKVIGFLTLQSRPNKRNYFYYEDMELFDEISDKTGVALERIRLHLKFMRENELSLKSLAGSIAHELRNPLGAIKLSTENLSSTKKELKKQIELQNTVKKHPDVELLINRRDQEVENFKLQINKTIDLAASVIDMTLNELSGKKLDKEDFSYYSAYKSIIDAVVIYGYQTNEEKEQVIIKLEDREIKASNAEREEILISNISQNNNFILHIEDTAFKYIIFNLVKNALFYLKDYPNSKITIDFEENKELDTNLITRFKLNPKIAKYNVINVTDTGPGIADDIITKIFDSYFTSGKKGGTGVGLDFCQRVMGDFGGGIICQSELGKYTTFSLLFPILSDVENQQAIKEITEFENKRKSALKSGMSVEEAEKSLATKPIKHILLVDDIKLNIDILSKDLKEKCSNFNITIINNSVKAFELIKSKQSENKQFDLILTDIEMPDMDGVELTGKIRNDLALSKDNLPILAYSSREKRTIIDKALEAGVNHYYTKPKDLRFIARNIAKWVLDSYIPHKNVNHQKIIIDDNTFKDKHIIIADDQMVNLMMLSKKFQAYGANVTKCKDGKEIIELIQQDTTKYHLIVTDINMVEIGGIEATKEVRKIQKEYNKVNNLSHKVPIIAISGDNDKQFVMNMLNSGIDDYLTKGCYGEEMARLAKFWIDYHYPDQESNSDNDQISENKTTSKNNNQLQSNKILLPHFNDLFSTKEEKDELINIFETESNIIMEEILDSKNEIEPLRRAIHKLKGSSGSVGANKLFLYTAHINSILQQEKMPEDEDFNQKIKELLDASIAEMRK